MVCNGMASPLYTPGNGFLLQVQTAGRGHEQDPPHRHLPSSLGTLAQDYDGVAALLGKRSVAVRSGQAGEQQGCEGMNGEDDQLSDDCSQLGEKKRRLNMEQVRTLEKNFELGNKLEPERKMQLARTLGLQPRQIAIWFQNRRARWKTKQLEKDYDVLRKRYEAIKSENDALQAHNRKLQAEIMALNGREISSEPINLNKETDQVSCSYRSDNSSDVNLEITRTPPNNESDAHNSHHGIASFFPIRPPVMPTHLLHRPDFQCPKVEQGGGQEESFCTMFGCSLDDQPSGFWTPWQEQQGFH